MQEGTAQAIETTSVVGIFFSSVISRNGLLPHTRVGVESEAPFAFRSKESVEPQEAEHLNRKRNTTHSDAQRMMEVFLDTALAAKVEEMRHLSRQLKTGSRPTRRREAEMMTFVK